MPAPIIRQDASLGSVRDDVVYTQARLAANPLTSALAADFDPALSSWDTTRNQEVALRTAVVKATAVVAVRDDVLNDLVDEISRAILVEVKGDRTAPLYVLYFGTKTPSEVKRPVLGDQLSKMRTWVGSLSGSTVPALQDLGAKLADAVAAADTAVEGLAAAEHAVREFRTTGPRKLFIDSVNALRKDTYGKLSKIPHDSPELYLSPSFAEAFFRHESRKPSAKLTSGEIQDQIDALEADLADLKAQLEDALAAEKAAEKDKLEADALAADLAAAEKEAAAALAKVAALKALKK